MFQDTKSRVLLILLATVLLAQSARAVTFFKENWLDAPDAPFADIVGDPEADPPVEPELPLIWDHLNITYKFHPSFTAVFPDAISRNAVLWAFEGDGGITSSGWEGATGSIFGVPEDSYADYGREWGPTIYDMKSIALHELGHGMGLGHPFQGAALELNYRYDPYNEPPGGYDPGFFLEPPWVPTANTEREVMGYGPGSLGVASGVMNRFLGWDEINGSRFSYGMGAPLDLIEVGPDDPADITIMAENLGPTGILAWNTTPHWAGGTIQMWNSWYADQVGIQPTSHSSEWGLTLGQGPAYGIALQVGESADAEVLAQDSYTTGNHYLENYDGGTVPLPGDGSTWHTWTDPSNNHPLVGETSVGLTFDTETWGVRAAVLLDISGAPIGAIPSIGATSYAMRTVSPVTTSTSPLGTYIAEETILERGITLRGTPDAPSLLTRVLLADVTDMDLQLGDLNPALLDIVAPIARELCMPCMGEIILGLDEKDHVLLFTDGSNLTPEMLNDPTRQFHIINDPEASYILTFDEILVILESEMTFNGELLEHRSYQILGQRMTGIADQNPLLPGDVNGDGFVGGEDMTIILSNWGLSGVFRPMGDLTGDGVVAGEDYTELLTYWGTGNPPGAVPEPLSLILLLLGGLLLGKRP